MYSLETRHQVINEQLRLSKVTRCYSKGSFLEMNSLKPQFLVQSLQSFKVFVEGIQVVSEFDLTFSNFLTGIYCFLHGYRQEAIVMRAASINS